MIPCHRAKNTPCRGNTVIENATYYGLEQRSATLHQAHNKRRQKYWRPTCDIRAGWRGYDKNVAENTQEAYTTGIVLRKGALRSRPYLGIHVWTRPSTPCLHPRGQGWKHPSNNESMVNIIFSRQEGKVHRGSTIRCFAMKRLLKKTILDRCPHPSDLVDPRSRRLNGDEHNEDTLLTNVTTI